MSLTLSVAHASRPKAGETENGDAALVRQSNGAIMVGVVDALGHGPVAARATRIAIEYLNEVGLQQGISAIMRGLHGALIATRGAAATVFIFDAGRLQGAGVGNVTLRSCGTAVAGLLSPGVLGHRLQRLRVFEASLAPGDRIVLFSDGIATGFDLKAIRTMPPPEASDAILRHAGSARDDATILVADVIEADSDSKTLGVCGSRS